MCSLFDFFANHYISVKVAVTVRNAGDKCQLLFAAFYKQIVTVVLIDCFLGGHSVFYRFKIAFYTDLITDIKLFYIVEKILPIYPVCAAIATFVSPSLIGNDVLQRCAALQLIFFSFAPRYTRSRKLIDGAVI